MDVTAEREKLFEYLKKTLEYQPESLKDIAVISKEMREILRDMESTQSAAGFNITFSSFEAFISYLKGLGKVDYCDWQLEDWNAALNSSEYCWIRARGGSKTRDAAILAVWWALEGKEVLWKSAGEKQLKEVYKKFRDLKPIISKVTAEEVTLFNGTKIAIGILTDHGSHSERGDCLIIDEERSAKREFCADARECLSVSKDAHILHCSTPAIDTPIEDTYTTLAPDNLVSIHPWQDCYWINRDHVEQERKRLTSWEFEINFECRWTVMGGSFFEPYVVECDVQPVHGKKYGGLDWNGSPGHVLVVIQQSGDGAYILEEQVFPYERGAEAEIEKYCKDNNISLEVEAGGANLGFVPNINAAAVAVTGKWKEERINLLIGGERSIFIDPKKTPLTRKDLQKTAFKLHTNKMEKRDDMHWVDALLHAVHENTKFTFAEVGSVKAPNRWEAMAQEKMRGY